MPPSLREEVRYRVFQKTTMNSRVFMPLWEGMKKKDIRNSTVAATAGRRRSLLGGFGKGGKGGDAADVSESFVKAQQEVEKRDMLARELVRAMEFEVYNPGEWVLHKGMLNENFFIVTVGKAQVWGGCEQPRHPLHPHLSALLAHS